MTLSRVILALCLSGFFFSCKDERILPGDPVPGTILFTISEQYRDNTSESTPVITLNLRTQKSYPCVNYSIIHRVFRSGNIVEVDVYGISRPELCLTAIGPATGWTYLDLTVGHFTLMFKNGILSDRYDLVITDSTIQISPDSAMMTRPLSYLQWRYPQKSFAYICGAYTGLDYLCASFADTLTSRLRLTPFLVPSDGAWPYPLQSNGYYVNVPGTYYRYGTETDFDSAGALLKSFTIDFLRDKSGMGIELVNWRNRAFYSWMLNPTTPRPDQNWYIHTERTPLEE